MLTSKIMRSIAAVGAGSVVAIAALAQAPRPMRTPVTRRPDAEGNSPPRTVTAQSNQAVRSSVAWRPRWRSCST